MIVERDGLVDRLREALRGVIDPEIGFNIVDIGLVYDIAVDGDANATITMTTTTRGCPASGFLKDGAGEAARSVAGVKRVDVALTYDPPWTPELMSETAKLQLGFEQ